jgi:hypothetical protein
LTWVIAHANPFVTVMISDVRISVQTDTDIAEVTDFGVQKIYHVAPTVFAGFAGSIGVGFHLIDDLDMHLQHAYAQDIATSTLAAGWAEGVVSRLASVNAAWRPRPTSLIVAGMHLAPVVVDGVETDEHMPFGSGAIVRFPRGLDSRPVVKKFGWSDRGVSFGSGAEVAEYRKALSEIDWVQLSSWGGHTEAAMTGLMQLTIANNPTPGISPDLMVMIMIRTPDGLVGRGRAFGPLASDRSRIATDERELDRLWRRYRTSGQAEAAQAESDSGRCAAPRATFQQVGFGLEPVGQAGSSGVSRIASAFKAGGARAAASARPRGNRSARPW